MKICKECLESKEEIFFFVKNSRTGSLNARCKSCICASSRKRYALKRLDVLLQKSEYAKRNCESIKERNRAYYAKNGDVINSNKRNRYAQSAYLEGRKVIAHRARTWSSIKERDRTYVADREKKDHKFKLMRRLRSRLSSAFRRKGFGLTSKLPVLVGCEWHCLVSHISSKFKEGMTLENYGAWHIDHVIPLASAKSEEELIRLCHFSNLQPLWASENIRKGASLPVAE